MLMLETMVTEKIQQSKVSYICFLRIFESNIIMFFSSELEDMGAKVFGKEACRYFPTGLMGNLASVMSHCWERGSEVILGDLSHIQLYEQGGVSTVSPQKLPL